MKPEELRIGNHVGLNLKEFPENYFTMVEVAADTSVVTDGLEWHPNRDRQYFDPEYLEGIPLTEEWLIKFGFTKHFDPSEQETIFNLHEIINLEMINENVFSFDYGGTVQTAMISKVHQLQNLIHALTGQELTIKEK